MFKIQIKTIRPDRKAAFYPIPESVDNLQNELIQSGTLLKKVSTISKDSLIKTVTMVWKSRADMLEFNSTPQLVEFIEQRSWYNQENSHIVNFITKEVDDVNE
jgi:hypothetical protein